MSSARQSTTSSSSPLFTPILQQAQLTHHPKTTTQKRNRNKRRQRNRKSTSSVASIPSTTNTTTQQHSAHGLPGVNDAQSAVGNTDTPIDLVTMKKALASTTQSVPLERPAQPTRPVTKKKTKSVKNPRRRNRRTRRTVPTVAAMRPPLTTRINGRQRVVDRQSVTLADLDRFGKDFPRLRFYEALAGGSESFSRLVVLSDLFSAEITAEDRIKYANDVVAKGIEPAETVATGAFIGASEPETM